MAAHRRWAGTLPLHQDSKQKGEKRGQAAFWPDASLLLHRERDGDSRHHPAATVTGRVKPRRQQGRHACAGKAGRAAGLLPEGTSLDLRVGAQLCTTSPPEPARRGCSVQKSGSGTDFPLSTSAHLNHFQIFSASPDRGMCFAFSSLTKKGLTLRLKKKKKRQGN